MYQVFIKQDSGFDSRKMIGEFQDFDLAYDKVEEELEKDKNIKYVIEEITGRVDNYGELIRHVVEEN